MLLKLVTKKPVIFTGFSFLKNNFSDKNKKPITLRLLTSFIYSKEILKISNNKGSQKISCYSFVVPYPSN